MLGVATEAFRSASNGATVLARIHEQTGWHIRVIDGLEEARLTFQGLRSQIARFPACVVADVGGGSTELLSISAGILKASVSVPIGSGRFADRYFCGAAPTEATLSAARAAAEDAFSPALPWLPRKVPLVLSGGNGVFLERLAKSVDSQAGLSVVSLPRVAEELMRQPAAAIAKLLSISVERAGVLPAGAAIALGAVDAFSASEVVAVPSGIREGVLLDWIEAQGYKVPDQAEQHLARQAE